MHTWIRSREGISSTPNTTIWRDTRPRKLPCISERVAPVSLSTMSASPYPTMHARPFSFSACTPAISLLSGHTLLCSTKTWELEPMDTCV